MDPGEVRSRLSQFTHVYRASFTKAPWNEKELHVEQFSREIPKYTNNSEFRCVVAKELVSDDVVGFAFGYASGGVEYIRKIVRNSLGEEDAQEWLSSHFFVAEIALDEPFRGKGIGSRLHDHLLKEVTYRYVVTCTHPEASPADHLFQNRGWQILTLLPEFYYSGNEDSTWHTGILLGLDLLEQHSSDA
jgi:GNAT superfamily N-acetyltransferase